MAPEPAEGHVALAVDGVTLWERTVAIPSDPCSYTDVFESPLTAAAGATLQLHLHNHGANTWNVFRVERAPADEPLQTALGCAR